VTRVTRSGEFFRVGQWMVREEGVQKIFKIVATNGLVAPSL